MQIEEYVADKSDAHVSILPPRFVTAGSDIGGCDA
jgi:hypothetical protein